MYTNTNPTTTDAQFADGWTYSMCCPGFFFFAFFLYIFVTCSVLYSRLPMLSFLTHTNLCSCNEMCVISRGFAVSCSFSGPK